MTSPPHGDADAEPPFLEVWDSGIRFFFIVVLAYVFDFFGRIHYNTRNITMFDRVRCGTQVYSASGDNSSDRRPSAFEAQNGSSPCP